MQLIALKNIDVPKRQRKSIDPAALLELKISILSSTGLLHPPVLIPASGDRYLLLVGERRFRAIESIAKDKLTYQCNGQDVAAGYLAANLIRPDLSPSERQAAEFDENAHRVDLTWQEKSEALAELHKIRSEENPKQTFVETAVEAMQSGTPAMANNKNLSAASARISQAVIVAQHLKDPAVASARNATEAYNLILRRQQHAFEAALSRKSQIPGTVTQLISIRCGDLHDVLPKLETELVDLIFADPPYGISATGPGFRARTAIHHDYEDTPEAARRVALSILREGFRISKPRANLLLFTDIAHWDWLQRQAKSMGWTPFRRPLIWGKSQTEGLAPWGGAGPRITTELIFYATKGQRGMTNSPVDYIPESRVPRNERDHAAEKPVALLKYLIECCTLPGDFVLDPCCGSGSTLVAAKLSRRTGLGIELDQNHANTATARLAPHEP